MVTLNKENIEALCFLCDGLLSVTDCCALLAKDKIMIELITCAEDMALIVNLEQNGSGAIFQENDQAYGGYELRQLVEPFLSKRRRMTKPVLTIVH